MASERFKQPAELFGEALGAGDEKASGTDPEARTLVAASDGGRMPERIGRYRIHEEIASGGMGVVYRAEQLEPVRRAVAVKLVKAGLDTREVIARFESERQALALMAHANIARVFDAGTTADGRPYFVMEYVPGVPITEYCDKSQLPLKERLELFLRVCDGVQHAHHKGVIHRDLKPSNILVMLEEGRPVPKIIDFGIAKAVSQRLTDKTLHTEFGRMMGTPAYMSPEQAEMSGLDVDTRADVYALGVLLYELLVGATPFSFQSAGTSFDEMRRQIREVDPPLPSTVLMASTDSAPEVARNRRLDRSAIKRALRGDLDWITLKALEKNRARRYGSPAELAADVERHLRDEPVLAGPPSPAYRIGKFVRRNRLAVVAASSILLALVTGAVLATVGLVRAREAEQRALQEAAATDAINRFLQDMLRSSDPERGVGREVTVAEALAAAEEKIDERFGDQPELEAEVRHTLGTTYLHLASYERAEELLLSSLEIRQRLFGREHEDVAASLNELARLYQARGDLERAEASFREALAINRSLPDSPPGAVAMNLNNLGMLLYERGELDEAEAVLREALAKKRELYGDVHEEVTPTLNNLGLLLSSKQDLDEAEHFLSEALQANRTLLGQEHALVARNLHNLAWLEVDRGQYARAVDLFREALEMKRKVEGEDHPSTATTLTGLATAYEKLGDCEAALPLYDDAIAIMSDAYEATHWRLGYTRIRHGACLLELERFDEAEQELLTGLGTLEATLGDDDPKVVAGLRSLVELYEALDRPRDASRIRARLPSKSEASGP